MARVFLSYSREDAASAQKLADVSSSTVQFAAIQPLAVETSASSNQLAGCSSTERLEPTANVCHSRQRLFSNPLGFAHDM